MKINIDKSISINEKCETCDNNGICKYLNEYTRILKEVSEIDKEFESPVSIITTCTKYQKKLQKQDGFYAR